LSTRAESLDRHPGGFHPQGRPRHHLGGGPGLGLSPDSGKEASPFRGVSESAGREAPKEWRRPKGSTGEGTPRRDPGGPAGRSRPQGRARSGLQDQPRRPRPICGGAARPHRVSHGRPQAQMGRGARGLPRDSPGETGAGLVVCGGQDVAASGRWDWGRVAPGEKPALKPGSAHRRPNPPAPPGRGPSLCPRLRKSALCAGVTLLQPKAAYRPSPPARPLPPGPG
jgi:hypothetical protein